MTRPEHAAAHEQRGTVVGRKALLALIICAYCHGDGDACNPGNADPAVKVTEWLYPIACPRCGGTGKDPNP